MIVSFDLTEPEGEVIIVLDRSTAAGASNQNRCSGCTTYWDSLRDAIEVLTDNQGDQFHFGLKLYPSVAAGNSCQVADALDVPVSSSGGQEIRYLLDSTTPEGQAPATLGLRSGINHLSSSGSYVPRMIILAMVGLPTCGGADITQDDTLNVMTEIGQAAAAGVPVFVLGAGRNQTTLSLFASEGNTDTVYSAYRPEDLQFDMQMYAMVNAPCTFALPNDIGPSPTLSLYFEDWAADERRTITGFTVADDGTSLTLDDEACAELRGPTVFALTIGINCSG